MDPRSEPRGIGESADSQAFTAPRVTSHLPRKTVLPEMTEQYSVRQESFLSPTTDHETGDGLDTSAEPGVTVIYAEVSDK